MNKATFDPAQPLKLYLRCARNGTLDFVFVDENGDPYSLIYEDVELHFYKNEGDKNPVYSLTSGNGISYPSEGTVRATVTIAGTNLNEGQYYYELYRPDLGLTWIADYAIFHNGRFDGLQQSSTTVQVTSGQDTVNITVQSAGLTFPAQSANLVYAGPPTGSAAVPTFRALVMADLPMIKIKTVSTTTYTIVTSDNGYQINFTNASGCAVTLPNSLQPGLSVFLIKKAAGNVTVSASGTLQSVSTTLSTLYESGRAIHEGSNVWGFYTGGTGTGESAVSSSPIGSGL